MPKPVDVTTLVGLMQRYYPDAHCALEHSNPEELLIATILSAQCTDERVNQVTRVLFKRYPTMSELAQAKVPEVEGIVRPTGFFKNKARNIIATAKELVRVNNGRVPRDFELLVQLPGVGRKTANVVMGNAFNVATGIVVDTHVGRLSRRMGLARQDDPVKIEIELQKKIPQKNWIMFSHWLIWHGRQVCKARRPQCENCFLHDICPKRL